MDDLEDELDLRFHRGVKPEVYYRAPNTESLDGAIRNELERNASSLIPSDIVTEFVFAVASTITIPVTLQADLEALIDTQDYPQSIQAEYALCRDFDGKDRLKIQRAVSKSIVAAIQEADGFKYSERSAYNTKAGRDGVRFRYVCQDSLENRDRKRNKKKEDDLEGAGTATKAPRDLKPTHDCGGAIHVKFSIQREAINVVYKHNLIHRDFESQRAADGDSADVEATSHHATPTTETPSRPSKRGKRSKKDHHATIDDGFHGQNLDMSTSTEAPKLVMKRKRKSDGTTEGKKKPTKKVKTAKSAFASTPAKSKKRAAAGESSPQPRLAPKKACIRCREKKIKCNEAKPSCDQCKRGLWTCQYQVVGGPKTQRSRNGCLNCKQRRRKCTEEKPFCLYCLKIDDDCQYAEYS